MNLILFKICHKCFLNFFFKFKSNSIKKIPPLKLFLKMVGMTILINQFTSLSLVNTACCIHNKKQTHTLSKFLVDKSLNMF